LNQFTVLFVQTFYNQSDLSLDDTMLTINISTVKYSLGILLLFILYNYNGVAKILALNIK